jgi:SAM-dependent methyltransferase
MCTLRLKLGPESFVVEAASNDGYLLQYFRRAGIRVLGIEPARNVAAVARNRGIDTVAEFLDEELAQRVVDENGPADLVVANNVLAHVPDPNGFVSALVILAGGRGRISIEVPYLRELVEGAEFDTIYHEHLSYFSLTALTRLVERHDVTVVDVERLPVHGGSLRIWLAASTARNETVDEMLDSEVRWGVADSSRYRLFSEAVDGLRVDIHDVVSEVAARATVAAYGAAAKGVVLANVCSLDAERIRFVADRNPHKQGRVFPGVRIPVVPPDVLREKRPDYCVLLARNLATEILAQQKAYLDGGGRFIVPLPKPTVLAA